LGFFIVLFPSKSIEASGTITITEPAVQGTYYIDIKTYMELNAGMGDGGETHFL